MRVLALSNVLGLSWQQIGEVPDDEETRDCLALGLIVAENPDGSFPDRLPEPARRSCCGG